MPAVHTNPAVGLPSTIGNADTDQRSKPGTSRTSMLAIGAPAPLKRSRATRSAVARSGSWTRAGGWRRVGGVGVGEGGAAWFPSPAPGELEGAAWGAGDEPADP